MTLDPGFVEQTQRLVCQQRGVEFVASPLDSKLGFARTTKGLLPINGLRSPTVGETNGWYVWCGEQFSEDVDFFVPLHALHLIEDCPDVAKLLGLPPGSRFLLAKDYLDIWFDPALLIDL